MNEYGGGETLDRLIIEGGLVVYGENRFSVAKADVIVVDGAITEIRPPSGGTGGRAAGGRATGGDGAIDGAIVINAEGKTVIPGLVNAHYHSYANLVKGLAPTVPLEEWMLYIMEQGNLLTPDDMYWNAMLGAVEMIRTGTTAVIDHLAQGRQALGAAMQAYGGAGMRACIAPMISDKTYASTLPLDDATAEELLGPPTVTPAAGLISMTVDLFREWNGRRGRLSVGFGPSGPQRCSDSLITECARLAREYGAPLHTHVLETRAQAQTAERLYGVPMVRHLDRLGALGPNTSLAHGVWLNDEEISLAADRGAIAVHNPASNFLIGSGIAPVNKYRKAGTPLALGTDGANACGNPSMFDSMKLAAMIHNRLDDAPEGWLTTEDVFRIATAGGATAFGRPARFGSISPGKRADIVILNPARSLSLTPDNSLFWQLVHGKPSDAVETVIIEGHPVMVNGVMTTVSEEKVRREALERGERIRSKFMRMKPAIDERAARLRLALRG
ncbi:MAG: amidohydrolase [Firmicutes bacterium]|nr:amidohydrolase [Bacillota bacterium]